MAHELGRVADPAALAAEKGSCARLAITVPIAWSSAGATLSIVAPKRLACARCDGGGCDACGRSGALRAPDDERTRTLRITLPARRGGAAIVRIARPFGSSSAIAQLLIEVRPAAKASEGVTALSSTRLARAQLALWVALVLGVLLAVALAVTRIR